MRKFKGTETEKVSVPVEQFPWDIGGKYITRQDLYVWDDAGENKKVWEDGDPGIADEFGNAMLNSGTMVIVKDVEKVDETYWVKTDLGWLCGKNPKITYIS